MTEESINNEFEEQESSSGQERPQDRFRRLLSDPEWDSERTPPAQIEARVEQIQSDAEEIQDGVELHHPTGETDQTGGWYSEIGDEEFFGPVIDDAHSLQQAPKQENAPSEMPRHPTGAPEQTGGWFYGEDGKPVASTMSMPSGAEKRDEAGATKPIPTGRKPQDATVPPTQTMANRAAQPMVPRRVQEVDMDATQVTPAAYRPTVNQRATPQQAARPQPPVMRPVRPGPDTQSLRTAPPSKSKLGGCLIRLLIGLLFIGVFVTVVFFSFGIYKYFSIVNSPDFPNVSTLYDQVSKFETATIYDRNGNMLYEIVDPQAGRRTYVRLDQMSPYVIAATLATEDKEFYNHPGYDPIAMLRAIWQNRLSGETVSGASTITQQLARTLLISPEERAKKTVERKEREIVLAAELTRLYSKDEILELYLNEIYYSNLAYGIEAAAQTYFDVSAQNLDLGQATFLAGLPQSPGVYDIFTKREQTLRRHRDVILLTYELSQEKGCIEISTQPHPICVSAQEADQARRQIESYNFRPKVFVREYPHWVEYIRSLLNDEFGEEMIYRAGFRVYTTLDSDLQKMAERIVQEQIVQLAPNNANGAALVHMDNATGEILAMVGSPNFYNEEFSGQVNMSLAPRQTGSAFKPFVYTAAFEKGWTPATLIWDVPTKFPPTGIPNDGLPVYEPVNYDLRFHGPVLVRSALGNSFNIPAVKALQYVGIYRDPDSSEDKGGMIRFAQRVGITTLDRKDYGLALALGGGEISLLELTSAYSIFPNGGNLIEPVAITRIEARSDTNHDYEVIYERPPIDRKQVIAPEHAFLITSILSDNEARTPMFGANSVLNLPFPAAAKTGTTNDFRDNWTLGFTVNDMVGVWVGNPNNEPMRNTSGLTGAAPIWSSYMREMVNMRRGGQSAPFPRTGTIDDHIICSVSGTRPSEFCNSQRTEMFARNQPPLPETDDVWRVVHVDTWTGKLVSDACKDFDAEEFTMNILEKEAQEWIQNTSDGRAWASGLGFNPPVLFSPEKQCAASDPRPIMFFPGLDNNQRIDTSSFDIYVVAYATDQFKEFRLEYGVGENPASWENLVSGIRDQYRQPERLYTWDLADVPRGKVTLRIYMESTEERYAEYRLRLDLQHPEPTVTPTATPTLTPTATETPQPSATPTLPAAPTSTPTVAPTSSGGLIPAILTAVGGGG